MNDEYFTLLVPFVPKQFATAWHPTESDGPFAVLTRGAFDTEVDAIGWAITNLAGTPYTVKKVSNR